MNTINSESNNSDEHGSEMKTKNTDIYTNSIMDENKKDEILAHIHGIKLSKFALFELRRRLQFSNHVENKNNSPTKYSGNKEKINQPFRQNNDDTLDYDSKTTNKRNEFSNLTPTKIRTRNNNKLPVPNNFSQYRENEYSKYGVRTVLYKGLIPHIKPKSNLFTGRVIIKKNLPKLSSSFRKVDGRNLLSMNPRSSSDQTSFELKKKYKPRWYDFRPRLIINRYYRQNFMVQSSKKNGSSRVTISEIWSSYNKDNSTLTPVKRLSIPMINKYKKIFNKDIHTKAKQNYAKNHK